MKAMALKRESKNSKETSNHLEETEEINENRRKCCKQVSRMELYEQQQSPKQGNSKTRSSVSPETHQRIKLSQK